MQQLAIPAVSAASVSVMEISFDAAIREWASAAFAAERAPKPGRMQAQSSHTWLPGRRFLNARYFYWCQLGLALLAWYVT